MSFPWRTALFVSLALNLVLISAAVGAFASGARLERPAESTVEAPMPPRLAGQRAFMMALPPDVRAALRRELAGEVIGMREQRAAARQARLDLFEAARAEPYDPARVRNGFAAVRAADGAVLEGFHDALADALGRIDTADRATALDALGRAAAPGPDTQRAAPADDAPLTPEAIEQRRQERRERFREKLRERREQAAP
jgi:uncharacterized membrane protein